jgi:signal transduction histidine kinase
MLRSFLAKLKAFSRGEERKDHVSILLPFLIIAAALGVLAWRSYQLSVRMESGANTLARQYAGYAAETTARRVDAAVRVELVHANDEWQNIDRRMSEPSFAAFQEWANMHPWIVTAIYVPDLDPANSHFVSELAPQPTRSNERLTREIFTSGGTVRYTYDPAVLLSRVTEDMKQQPVIRDSTNAGNLEVPDAKVSFVLNPKRHGVQRLDDGYDYIAGLSPPLDKHGVRAIVRMTHVVGSGWENHRLVSLLVSTFAMLLMAVGLLLAWRGLKKESETTKLRGALIANVSHELRTPLSMIRLGAETLKRGSKLKDGERQEIEDQILREVLHLSHLVENVLDVARIQHRHRKALAFQPVYPSDLVEELVTTYGSWIQSKGFTVAMDIDDAIEEQMWDREAVSRALLNLIDNAIKYSGDTKAIEIRLHQTEKHVVLEVHDHGIGIEAKDQSKIFDPYYRAQFSDTQTRRGAGLGLTLVQQIVASHGGRVEVESQAGEGSTFKLVFPLTAADEEPEEVATVGRAREAF